MNQITFLKKDTNSYQISIHAALNFLKKQKNSSTASLSVRRIAFNYRVAEQTLYDA
ncbi:2149_t:CDS:1, partial [Scutellospora calospora]